LLIFQTLLRLYPKSFRAEYGDEMTKDFAREWAQANAAGRVALSLRALLDTATNASRLHLDITRQDLRYAIRSLRRTPGFTLTAILVAALGIGATTATFSIADHVLLRPLPFPEPDRLIKVWEDHSSRGYPQMEPSPPTFQDWQRMNTVFEPLEAYTGGSASLVGSGEPEQISGASMGPSMFRLLGRQAALGRVLIESDLKSEDRPIVISDRLWRTRFAASPDVLGQNITLDDRAHLIVGVMPADFHFPSRNRDFWRLLRFTNSRSDTDRSNQMLEVLGRLKPGVSIDDARAEMKTIAAQLAQAYPRELGGKSVSLAFYGNQISGQSRLLLLGLVGASICVLMVACTNLANLLMSRALARRTEFAIRAAVGASVDRLVRQMLTDSLLLAGAGGILGVVLALAAAPLLVRLIPTALPISELPSIDLRMLAGAVALTVTTGLAFGLFPALRVCKKADGGALKEGARGGTSGRATERLRAALVVAEIVAAMVLLTTVGLLTAALSKVQGVHPGFSAEQVLTMRTALPRPKYAQAVTRAAFYDRVLADVKALPGVESAAFISFLPMVMRGGVWEVLSTVPDPTSPQRFAPVDSGNERRASFRYVTPGFFATIRTPIIRGRDVSETDTLTTPDVAVVSESFVKQYFPDRDPIGQQFAIAFKVRTIVGVVGDIRVRGLERESEPQVYVANSQFADGQPGFYVPQDLAIRSKVPLASLVPAVRAIIRAADPQLPIINVRSLEEVVSAETAPRTVQLRVLGAFAFVAFLLAAIGIHGLLSFNVAARAREIGVRIALGAKGRDIVGMVLGRSAIMAVTGVAIGSALAFAAGRSMQSLLFGVDPANPAVFAAAIGLALLMTLAGSLLPALRAVRVDPIAATRTE
jgi:putative ABC transport system permease protein